MKCFVSSDLLAKLGEFAQGVKIVAKEASEEVEGHEGSPLNILRSQIGRFAHLHLVGFALMLCYTLEIERNWWDSDQQLLVW